MLNKRNKESLVIEMSTNVEISTKSIFKIFLKMLCGAGGNKGHRNREYKKC